METGRLCPKNWEETKIKEAGFALYFVLFTREMSTIYSTAKKFLNYAHNICLLTNIVI